jgi:hypothetical protein
MLSSGPALGFGAALTWGLVDVLVAVLARRAPLLTVTLAVHASGVCLLAILALALGDTGGVTGAHWPEWSC